MVSKKTALKVLTSNHTHNTRPYLHACIITHMLMFPALFKMEKCK